MQTHTKTLPILQTDRLSIRLADQSDAPKVLSYFQRNLEHLQDSNPTFSEDFLTLDYWKSRLEQNVNDYFDDKSVRLFLFKTTDADVIGTASLTQITRGALQSCYLGYGLDQSHQGAGFMHEALIEIITFAFGTMNLHRIMANYMPNNTRSANVLKRLGFEVEGLAKDYLMLNGQWQDHVLTSLVNTNWTPSESKCQ